ncbi:hypothetical protein JCM8115_006313 [Rhodotorula mucilaginosa]
MLDLQGKGDAPYATDLLSLDADGVHQLWTDLGYPHYHEQLHEHGITGDVLVHLDHAALKDVGVHSVGQRLAILKTVYDLKVAQNIPIEEGHYVPPSEDFTTDVQLHTQQVINLLGERDDRIRLLEYEVLNLHSALNSLRDESLNLARANLGVKGQPRPNMRSPTSASFAHPLSNASTLSRSSSTPSRPRNPPPVNISSSLAIPPSSHPHLPDSPNSPVVDSPRQGGNMHQHQQQPQHQQGFALPYQQLPHQQGQVANDHHHHLHPAEISINGVSTPTTPTAQMLVPPDSAAAANGAPVSSSANNAATGSSLMPSSARINSSPHDAPGAVSGLSPASGGGGGDRRQREVSTGAASAAGSSTADNPYRSFRVTVEDPCYKVLPAALKKYKINDDWRLYALFICYGNTERCLAYDEKPLLLFQKLKESNDNPVFMLRHIKDIKSPIAVASAKHAARRDKRPPGIGDGVERSLMGVNRDGSAAPSGQAAAAAATTPPANGLAPNARPTRLHHPPVLLPVAKSGGGEEGDAVEGDRRDDRAAKSANQGYCIAIYPYLAEREDEFDVAVGDTFVILSKTKGWWVVHRDQAPTTSATSPNPDRHRPARKSAWVPAGCLLETSVPPLSLLPADAAGDSSAHGNAASVPIPPSLVVSVSTPGVALMDYSPRGSGELEVRKGQPLRILKRYNHWSYAIKEDGGRGWLPSWFCGRANKTAVAASASSSSTTGTGHPPTDGATTAPSTPATPTVPTSNTSGSSGSVPSLTTLTSPISSSTSLAPPVHPYAASAAGAGDSSASTPQSTSTTNTPIPTPGHPGSLGKPDLSVAVSPASLRPGPLPTMTTTNGSGSGGGGVVGGPRSAGPTMQQEGVSGAGAGPERSAGGLPSSRSADAALAGTK